MKEDFGQHKINFPPNQDKDGQGFLDLDFNKEKIDEKKPLKKRRKKKNMDDQLKIDFTKKEEKDNSNNFGISEEELKKLDQDDARDEKRKQGQRYWAENFSRTSDHRAISQEGENFSLKKDIIKKIDEAKKKVRSDLVVSAGIPDGYNRNKDFFRDYKKVESIAKKYNTDDILKRYLLQGLKSYSKLRKIGNSTEKDDYSSLERQVNDFKELKSECFSKRVGYSFISDLEQACSSLKQ
jgi:hypothetical protein